MEGRVTILPELICPMEGRVTILPELICPMEGRVTILPELICPMEGRVTILPELICPMEGRVTILPARENFSSMSVNVRKQKWKTVVSLLRLGFSLIESPWSLYIWICFFHIKFYELNQPQCDTLQANSSTEYASQSVKTRNAVRNERIILHEQLKGYPTRPKDDCGFSCKRLDEICKCYYERLVRPG